MCVSFFLVFRDFLLFSSPHICKYADSLMALAKTNDETFDRRLTQNGKYIYVCVFVETIRLSQEPDPVYKCRTFCIHVL